MPPRLPLMWLSTASVTSSRTPRRCKPVAGAAAQIVQCPRDKRRRSRTRRSSGPGAHIRCRRAECPLCLRPVAKRRPHRAQQGERAGSAKLDQDALRLIGVIGQPLVEKITGRCAHGTTCATPLWWARPAWSRSPSPPKPRSTSRARRRWVYAWVAIRFCRKAQCYQCSMVEPRGFEPLTSAVRLRRSPN
jgi:hypothetical protein